mgnify:CR=1 FL=1
MTDQEKKEFLSEVLEENGWKSTHGCVIGAKEQVLRNHCRYSKEGLFIVIIEDAKEGKDIDVNIYINKVRFFTLPLKEYEIFSDHIEFTSFGVSVMIRLSDAYVLMEYQP